MAWPGYGRQGLGTRIFNAGKAQQKKPALAPTSPPPGFYDPAIDAQVRASSRGLADLFADTSTARLRGANDHTTARDDIFRQRDEGLADLLSGYNRGLADSQLGETRLGEDHSTAVENLMRSYTRLGGQQAQLASMAGLGGSAAAQSASKRSANEALDQAPIDTGYQRNLADLLTGRQRMTEDYGTNVTRTTQAADRGAGQLDLGWGRQQEDWQTQTDRAQRENTFFGQDANQQKWFQAKQAGYVAPSKPKAAKPKRKGR